MVEKLVIIGGVATGMKAAAKARRENPDCVIEVYQDEADISYSGCGMPYYISGVVDSRDKMIHRTPGSIKEKSNIEVFINHRVEKIDRDNKNILVLDLKTSETKSVKYDKLVISTGARSKKTNIKGIEASNVLYLNNFYESDLIKQAAKNAQSVLILGGGFLGLELAEASVELGLQTSLAVSSRHILRDFDIDIVNPVEKYLKQKGVNLYTSENVEEFISDDIGNVVKAKTNNREIQTDLVLICKGVTPNIELAKEAGLKIGESNAIWVNKYLQTSDKNIYAGGDCAEGYFVIDNKPVNYSSGSIASKQGRIIGENIKENQSVYQGSLKSRIIKVFDMTVAKTGYGEKEALDAGYEIETALVPGYDRAHYYPGADYITVKLIVNKLNHKLLGVQLFGPGDVSKRIDVIVVAITAGMTVEQVALADLTYAPPYSSAMDNLIVASNVLSNKLKGVSEAVTPDEFAKMLDSGKDDFLLMDIRSPDDYKESHIEGAENYPLGKLKAMTADLDKNHPIIIHCKIGRMSYVAYRRLKNLGFNNVKYVEGGIITWVRELEKAN